MALFAIWQGAVGSATALHERLRGEAHVVAERTVATILASGWHLSAFATHSHFYPVDDQIWIDPRGGGACIIHGLIWRETEGNAQLLTASDMAMLVDRPGAVLGDGIGGEYAVLRVFSDGTVFAFGDAAGLHQIFLATDGETVVANRAAFVATIREDWTADAEALLWLPAIGYRVGTGTAYRVVRMLPQEYGLEVRDGTLSLNPPVRRRIGPGAAELPEARADLFEQGVVQALATVRLATARCDRIDLPITGGKDSRVVLALCLAAGLRDRLFLFTRGYEEHPDVVAGAGVAATVGLPHRREAPHGSDQPAHWTLDTFVKNLAMQAYQTDGMMGGWDFIVGRRLNDETLITGHMGEVLKAYSKRPLPDGPLDPVTMIRLQAPFDPLSLLLPNARDALVAQVTAQMNEARAAGAREEDLPDLFYLRNRIPNWLGGIRGIKSFERQPVMPLGVPALMRLAFSLSAEERKVELLHYRLIERLAPDLLVPPFAMQTWDGRLADYGIVSIAVEPIRPGVAAPTTFGNWQYSVNSNPAIRVWLIDLVQAGDGPLWASIDRTVLIDRLRNHRFDYFDGISLLGLVAAMFMCQGFALPAKLGPDELCLAADERSERPIADEMRALRDGGRVTVRPPVLYGHIDQLRGARRAEGRWIVGEGLTLTVIGWLFAPELPGAQPAVEVMVEGEVLTLGLANRPRGDLAARGIGDGNYGIAIEVAVADLRALAAGRPEVALCVRAFDHGFVPIGGEIVLSL